MLNTDNCFPYPVLRRSTEDFKTAVFNDEHTIQAGMNCFHVRTNFSVNNTEINELIRNGCFSYALYIYCKSTMLRKLEYVSPVSDYRIPAGDVHHAVEVSPCIVAVKDVSDYHIADFDDDFKEISYSLEQGDIVGIGGKHTFDANYEEDIIKEGTPIIDIVEGGDKGYMKTDFNGPHIIVTLPKDQCQNYRQCKGAVEKYTLLHSVITIPVLVQAIGLIAEEDKKENEEGNGMAENPWFISINLQLKKIAGTRASEYQNLLENPVTAAQKIMDNNSSKSLLAINNM